MTSDGEAFMEHGFTLAVSQNKHLSTENDEMHAILTVTSGDIAGLPGGQAPPAAEVIAVDCSGSMGYPSTKIAAARNATAAAIDALRDGVFFAVIEGTDQVRMVYPPAQELVAATEESRRAAKARVRRLVATGGTAMGKWLRLAEKLLGRHPDAVRHMMLLTDGKNESETARQLDDALAVCAGKFVCDGRGIGDDYAPDELRRIVSTLNGSADAIVRDADLVADFTGMMRAAMSKVVPDLLLRIRTMPFARLGFVRQTFPTEAPLSAVPVPGDDATATFSTGSWAAGEDREFHVCLMLDRIDRELNRDRQAARVDLVIVPVGGAEPVGCGDPEAIRVHWTDDDRLSSLMNPSVVHYTGHARLAEAVHAGFGAHEAGDLDRAVLEWGRAVALATGLGDQAMLTRLSELVEIIGDPAEGVVRLRKDLRRRQILSAVLGSLKSTHSPAEAKEPPDRHDPEPVAGPDLTCPQCSHISPGGATYCMACGHQLGETA